MVAYFLIGLFGAVIAAMVAGSKGRSAFLWFFYGLLLWPLALIHALLVPRTASSERRRALKAGRLPCPHCGEAVLPEAKVCRHCGRDIPAGSLKRPKHDPFAKLRAR